MICADFCNAKQSHCAAADTGICTRMTPVNIFLLLLLLLLGSAAAAAAATAAG